MEYIEVTGRTIDDALTNACLKLETTSDNIEYEVIEKGSNGLFGIFNSKPTKIKARVKAGVGSVDDEFSKLEAKEKKSIDDTIKSEIKAESKKEVVKETEKAVKKETAPKADNSKVSATQAVNASAFFIFWVRYKSALPPFLVIFVIRLTFLQNNIGFIASF